MACSNTKCVTSTLNNDTTVKKKCFARCQAEEEVMAEVVVAVVGLEVQAEHPEDPRITAMITTRQRRWSLHHTVPEEINKVQHMTQSRSRSCMTQEDNTSLETI